MRKPSPVIIAAVVLLWFISHAVAQAQPAQRQPESYKDKLHTAYVLARIIDPNKAYQYANEYLQQFGSDNDDRTKLMRLFVIRHEYAPVEAELLKAASANDHAKVLALGRQIISKDAENLTVLYQTVRSAYQLILAGDKTLTPEALDYINKALTFLAPGNERNLPGNIKPDPTRGSFHYQRGLLLSKASPAEAAAAFRLAALLSPTHRADRIVYLNLGMNLQDEYNKLLREFRRRLKAEGATDSVKSLEVELKQLGNRTVDAYARFVALSTKPEYEASKADVLRVLTSVYKSFNNNSDAGIAELIQTVLTKPLP